MSVPQTLLAILDQGPCYGSQLRSEFDRRTGSTWPLNVGQISNTLERLERDGLVERSDADEAGHIMWRITDAGATTAGDWLRSPVERSQATRDELAIKLTVAATLPGVDVMGVIRRERAAATMRLDDLRTAADVEPESPEEFARSLVLDALVAAAEADLRWCDLVEKRLAGFPAPAFALAADRPKRGRPAAGAAAASVA